MKYDKIESLSYQMYFIQKPILRLMKQFSANILTAHKKKPFQGNKNHAKWKTHQTKWNHWSSNVQIAITITINRNTIIWTHSNRENNDWTEAIQINKFKIKPFNKTKTVQMNNNSNATQFKPSKVIAKNQFKNVFVWWKSDFVCQNGTIQKRFTQAR